MGRADAIVGVARPVKIVWNGYAALPAEANLGEALPPEDLAASMRKAAASVHPTFQLAHDLFVELPRPGWRGGDLLVYLPEHGWLVRRNKIEHWYVDVGMFRRVADDLFGWTDLWLDVIAPEPATHYHLLDAEELGAALRTGQVSTELAALALERLDALVRCIRGCQFPPPEVRLAEAFASTLRAAEEDRLAGNAVALNQATGGE